MTDVSTSDASEPLPKLDCVFDDWSTAIHLRVSTDDSDIQLGSLDFSHLMRVWIESYRGGLYREG